MDGKWAQNNTNIRDRVPVLLQYISNSILYITNTIFKIWEKINIETWKSNLAWAHSWLLGNKILVGEVPHLHHLNPFGVLSWSPGLQVVERRRARVGMRTHDYTIDEARYILLRAHIWSNNLDVGNKFSSRVLIRTRARRNIQAIEFILMFERTDSLF